MWPGSGGRSLLPATELSQGVRIAGQASILAAGNPRAALAFLHAHGLPAALGADGRTVVTRESGHDIAILPGQLSSGGNRAPARTAQVGSTSGGAEALVLEPFATSLNLGPDAGSAEVYDLRALGYNVTRRLDSEVDMGTMGMLSHYAVVYWETHAGVLPNGDAVIATGQTDTQGLAPLFGDHSLIQVFVAGDPAKTLFVAITGEYIRLHLTDFPTHALMYLNGCSVLAAPVLWNDLQARRVETLVSWNHDAVDVIEEAAADLVFGRFTSGDTVAQAVSAADAAGLYSSSPTTGDAHLGFEGNGALTLSRDASPTPTAAPTAMPTPAPTATPTVPPLPYFRGCSPDARSYCVLPEHDGSGARLGRR